ncbi:NADH-quinone oxidoreductase subunit C [Candidatus Methylomirabilis limnetica]|jgi:NADH-quinone oxidoreductase subunit C|uniref:NADH-quinone oxidoreductase subunit C n=1 Tax=Candidatus Methylomirabilis limnetica TaxID=2033718 RepID=A0A2T4U0W3_9BACT|nr:NADH-quinone oxidoreductase subunit C [Candidatus Methylomirabilis limnetica]PTL36986.1 NADH-quinone oxidoreductase subunit C [Candidatus Methylomirabilis limnetica]
MTPDEVTEAIKSQFGDAVKASEVKGVEARMDIHQEKNYEILIAIKGMGFDYLNCLSAVDRLASGELEVVYNISSLSQPTKVLVRVRIPREDPIIRSVVSLWGTADWHEREAFDMMGIRFDGHPDLRRILTSEDWVGYPLRKDYQDERLVPYEPV